MSLVSYMPLDSYDASTRRTFISAFTPTPPLSLEHSCPGVRPSHTTILLQLSFTLPPSSNWQRLRATLYNAKMIEAIALIYYAVTV